MLLYFSVGELFGWKWCQNEGRLFVVFGNEYVLGLIMNMVWLLCIGRLQLLLVVVLMMILLLEICILVRFGLVVSWFGLLLCFRQILLVIMVFVVQVGEVSNRQYSQVVGSFMGDIQQKEMWYCRVQLCLVVLLVGMLVVGWYFFDV